MTLARLARVLSFAAAAAVLAACGGGAGHATPLPGASAPAQSSTRQNVTFTFDVPTANTSAHARRPQYVSPATTQMAVNVQTGCPGACAEVSGYPQTVGLTPTSGGCTSSLATTTCALTLALSPGSYTATFTTLDAASAALSTAQSVAFTVVAGTTNTIALTLSGIPTALIATPIAPGSSAFTVNALDADHNVIVGGGAPTIGVAATSGIALTLTQPTTASPNIFSASPSATGTAVITVTASYPSGTTNACTQTGAVCTKTFTITSSGTLVGTDTNGESLVTFAIPSLTRGADLTPAGLNGPFNIAFSATGMLWVANLGNKTATEYAPPYTGSPVATITQSAGVLAVAVDTSGDVFLSGQSNVYEYAPPYTGAPTATIGGVSNVRQLKINRAGDVFLIDENTGGIDEFAPPYTAAPTAIADSDLPAGLAIDASDNLFVLEDQPAGFSKFPPPYTGSSLTNLDGVTDPESGALDSAGNFYVFDDSDGNIVGFQSPNYYNFSAALYSGPPIVSLAIVPGMTTLSIGP